MKLTPGGKTRLAKGVATSTNTSATTINPVVAPLWALRACATARRAAEARTRDRSLLATVAPHTMVGSGSLLATARGGVLSSDDVGRSPKPRGVCRRMGGGRERLIVERQESGQIRYRRDFAA